MNEISLNETSLQDKNRKEDLLTLSKFAHDWARHHQTMIMSAGTARPARDASGFTGASRS